VSAFAQSSVVITGGWDAGYRSTTVGNAPEKSQKVITNNNAYTSQIDFVVTEDLGGGLKAIAFGEADFQSVKPALTNASATNSATWYTGAFFNSEIYVGLTSPTMGTVKLGAPNSEFLLGNAKIQPFGTALGGGYSNTFGRMGTNANVGISGYMGFAETARVVRNERTIKYDSPVMNGAQVVFEYQPGNALGTGTSSNSVTTGTSYASNNNAWAATTLNYNNGPLTLTYVNGQISAGANQATGTVVTPATLIANKLTANGSVTYTMWGGNYVVNPQLTAYAGFTTTKSSNQTQAAASSDVEDSKSSNVALKYTMGQTDFLFNRIQRQSNQATDTVGTPNGASSLTGLGVNYNLSKNTMVYGRYEKASNVVAIPGTATATSANTSYGAQTISSLGLLVKF
jgi:predicted porin